MSERRDGARDSGGLRFGVLCDQRHAWPWQRACVERLREIPDVELAALFLCTQQAGTSPEGHPWAAACRDAPLTVVTPQTEASEIEAGVDFVLSFARSQPDGLLRLPRLGVWCFHWGDPERAGYDRPAFWEIHDGEATVTAALLALAREPGRARVLHQGTLRTTPYSLRRTCERLFATIAGWPARVCREHLSGDALAGPEIAIGTVQRSRAHARARLRRRMLRGFLDTVAERLTDERWNVGVVDAPIERFLEEESVSEARWLPRGSPWRCHADPLASPGRAAILLETYDYRSGRGVISALGPEWDADRMPTVIAPPVHASYPYLVEYGGEIYCAPETSGLRTVTLYRADSFPDRWVPVVDLLQDFAAVDPTLFQHEGRWWLLCTNGDDEDQAKLFGFMASDLFGPWFPHPLNPLKCDVRSARPAGRPFVHSGSLYRPTQDCARTYGGAVTINRVTRLTPTAFAEEVVTRVAPDPAGPYPDGLHTLCADGGRTWIDGKRHFHSPWTLAPRLWRAGAERIGSAMGLRRPRTPDHEKPTPDLGLRAP